METIRTIYASLNIVSKSRDFSFLNSLTKLTPLTYFLCEFHTDVAEKAKILSSYALNCILGLANNFFEYPRGLEVK